jgi:hypothetical protein
MKNTTIALSLVLLVSSVFAQWSTTPVDTAGTEQRGWWTAVDYRPNVIHVGYLFWMSQTPLRTAIRYARSTDMGSTWTVETADSAPNYGSGYATLGWFRGGLALDSSGQPHLAYTIEASVGTFCIHAWRTPGGTWLRETVEMRTSQPLVCHDADIAIDSRDRPNIVYTHYGVVTRYAVKTDSGWEIHDITGAGQPYGVALALDSADNPHIAVGTLSDTKYCYSSDGGATWLVENVASSWWQVDLCLARNGQPLIAYTETNSGIKFARRDGPGNWLFRTLDPGGTNSCRPSICREPGTDSLHVAFYPTMSSTELKHALSTDNGTGWNVETVTTTGGVSASSSCPGVFAADGLWLIGTQIPGYKLGVAIQDMSAIAEQGAFGLSRITAAPNPCRDFVRLSAPGMRSDLVSLYDRTGRIVARGAADGGTVVLDVRDLPSGVYLARADNSEAARARIVVAR